MLSWLSADGKILVASRTIRSLIQGFFSVIVSVYLSLLGYSDLMIGLALSIFTASSVAHIAIASFLERRFGRKRTLLFLAILSVAGSGILIFSSTYLGIIVAACIGPIVGGTSAGAFQTVEQAIIAQSASAENRTRAFAVYNIGGWIALSGGALMVSLPASLQKFGLGMIQSFRLVFALSVIAMVSVLIIYTFLSRGAETLDSPSPGNSRKARKPLSQESKRRISKLSALMGLDSFGGAFVQQSIASLWFYHRFGASLDTLSIIFLAANLASAVSFLVAANLAGRIGLVNTMVFTHLPSNIITALIPFGPTLPFVTGMFIIRGFLNPMDIAPRQSYIAAIVKPEERVPAAAYTNIVSNVGRSVSPSISGFLLQFVSLSVPFFIAGSLKSAYDLVLYHSFRSLKPPEEVDTKNDSGK
jgi:MFS family permease